MRFPASSTVTVRVITYCCLIAASRSVTLSSLFAETSRPSAAEPVVAAASNEAESRSRASMPETWTCQVFAAEPNVANPVVLTTDYQGRVFVCESFRQNQA